MGLRIALLSRTTILAGFALSIALVPAQAAYEEQAAKTKAYALKAVEFYRSKGMEAAKASFLTPKAWFLGPEEYNLHVSGITVDQMVWADSGFPEVVGTSYNDLDDLDGVPVGKAVSGGLAKSPDGFSIQLRFSNPVTKAVAHTEGYCVKADAANAVCAWAEPN